MPLIPRIALFLLPVPGVFGGVAAWSSAVLNSRYQAGQQHSSQLKQTIHNETSQIDDYDGTIGQLQSRLSALEHSVGVRTRLLTSADQQLGTPRGRLSRH